MEIVNIDTLTLVLGILVVGEAKRRRPDIFFLSRGATIFLPPEEQEEPDKKHKPKRKQATVRFVAADLGQLREFPLYEEYEKLFMMTSLMVLHTLLAAVLRHAPFLPEFFRRGSSLPFLVTFLLTAYALRYGWKVSTHNGYRSYEFKAALAVTAVLLACLGAARALLHGYLGSSLQHAVSAQSRHLDVLLAGMFEQPFSLSTGRVLALVLLATGLLVLVTIPSIMKYGHAYTQLLQEAHAEEEAQGTEPERLTALRLRLECRRQLKIFNIELVVWATLLLLWGVPPVREQLPDVVLGLARVLLLSTITFINILNFGREIELHLANAYKHIKALQESDRPAELLKEVRRKVYSYIHLFWYPSYQVLLRMVLPVLLLLMFLQKSQLNPQAYELGRHHYEISPTQQEPVRVNIETSCGLIKDPVLTLRQLYRCPANAHLRFEQAGLNGWQLALLDNSVMGIAGRVSAYGLSVGAFEAAVAEHLLWYFLLSRYLLTLLYILFLRKTVLDL